MSGTDDLRAARESRADIAQRATRPGMGDAVTRMVNAAVYRATHRPFGGGTSTTASKPVTHTAPEPLGPDFASAMRTAEARVVQLDQSELRTPDGTVRYVDMGTGSPVLLVHGIFGGADAALRQLRPFVPDGFRIIAPSRFGYLGSASPADASPARQADAFAALLDALGIEKTAVVAASAGATCALQLAIRHPERVSALVLVSSNGPGLQHYYRRPLPRSVAATLWGTARLMWLARHRFTNWLLRMMGLRTGRPLSAPDRARVDAELDGLFPVTRRVDGALFDAFVSNPDINHGYDFGRITAPTLIVHARDDMLAPCWGAVGLSELVPTARLLVVEDGGHLMLGDHPEVTTEIQALLRSTSD